jgi:hypothetical protein
LADKKRSAAAKKAAATRKAKQEAAAAAESTGEETVSGPTISTYQPRRRLLKNAGLDQHAAEEDRQIALEIERDEHNRRTGDASLV